MSRFTVQDLHRKISALISINLRSLLSLFRSVEPVSRKFGFDRGGPIDHYFIQRFLQKNSIFITGTVLEIADSRYSRMYGHDVRKFEVLHVCEGNPKATIVADLTKIDTLPQNYVDCFICTQTFNFIYDIKTAVKGAYHILKPGGVLLATVAGISQISRYDMDRWGDYWRFTTKSCITLFEEVFGKGNVQVESCGNCLVASAFLKGRSSKEFTKKELDYTDPDYQMLITIKALKK